MKSDYSPKVLIGRAELIFWDFDGVIMDSVSVKTSAFEKLFLPYGQKIAHRVAEHHKVHTGLSRFEKMPLYLTWAGENVTDGLIGKFCDLFSEAVFQSVIESPWVSGVNEYLCRHYQEKYFVLVTATPQLEIEKILSTLEINHFFRQVFGAPMLKKDAIRSILAKQKVKPDSTLMIGDAETDLLAAQANSVPFLLRRTKENQHLQNRYDGPQFDDLSYE